VSTGAIVITVICLGVLGAAVLVAICIKALASLMDPLEWD
jgi:hypothetical protein